MSREEMERLARAVLDGSARDEDVKRLAKAVLYKAPIEVPAWLVSMKHEERERWRKRFNAIKPSDVIAAVERAQEGKRE